MAVDLFGRFTPRYMEYPPKELLVEKVRVTFFISVIHVFVSSHSGSCIRFELMSCTDLHSLLMCFLMLRVMEPANASLRSLLVN